MLLAWNSLTQGKNHFKIPWKTTVLLVTLVLPAPNPIE